MSNEAKVLDALRIAGEPLGLLRLRALTGIENTPLTRTMRTLVNKGQVITRPSDRNQEWFLPYVANVVSFSEFSRWRALRHGGAVRVTEEQRRA